MPAGLALEAGMAADRLADGLLEGDARAAGGEFQPIDLGQPLDRGLEMDLALAVQHRLVRFQIVLDDEARVLLGDLLQRPGELDLVLAVLERDGERVQRGRGGRPLERRRRAVGREGASRHHPFEAGERHNGARRRLGGLDHLLALEAEDRADPLAVERRGLGERAAPDPDMGKPSGVTGVLDAKDLGERRPFGVHPAPRCRLLRARGVVAERLPQP